VLLHETFIHSMDTFKTYNRIEHYREYLYYTCWSVAINPTVRMLSVMKYI